MALICTTFTLVYLWGWWGRRLGELFLQLLVQLLLLRLQLLFELLQLVVEMRDELLVLLLK